MRSALVILCSLLALSCGNNDKEKVRHNEVDTPTKHNSNTMPAFLPYSSEDVEKYYEFNSETNEYAVTESPPMLHFTQRELISPIKENDLDIRPGKDDKYRIINTFKLAGDGIAKVILYNTYGENNIKLMNVQVNSYDKNGDLIDQLLVDNRLFFEVEYYRYFIIKGETSIEIEKYEINKLVYDENGDITGEKNSPDSSVKKVFYKIDERGAFIRLQ